MDIIKLRFDFSIDLTEADEGSGMDYLRYIFSERLGNVDYGSLYARLKRFHKEYSSEFEKEFVFIYNLKGIHIDSKSFRCSDVTDTWIDIRKPSNRSELKFRFRLNFSSVVYDCVQMFPDKTFVVFQNADESQIFSNLVFFKSEKNCTVKILNS